MFRFSAQKPEPAVHNSNTVTLQGENIQQIYSSPFFRTVQTAQEVASCIGDNVTIRIEDGLAEGMLTRKYIKFLICHATVFGLTRQLSACFAKLVLASTFVLLLGSNLQFIVGLFPAGRPNFQTPEELKSTCKSVDSHYKSLLHISFPEDYSDSQARCRQIARQLADRHPHDNVLLVTLLLQTVLQVCSTL